MRNKAKAGDVEQRSLAYEQALASARIEGYSPTADEIADGKALVEGTISSDEFRKRSAKRARDIEQTARSKIANAA